LKNSRAITFDSPGSMRSIERLQSNIQSTNTLIDIHNLDIITYLVEPNFVNTADRHIGRVYSLTDTSEQSNNQSTWISWPSKDAIFSTLNNHGLDKILNTMQCDFDSNSIEPKSEELKYKPSKYSLMSNWPLIEKKASTTTENSYPVTSIIGLIFNYGKNQINTNQLNAYHANKDEFYSNFVINNNDLLKNEELNLSSNNLNVDYFLNKLIDINLNDLNDQLIKSQLKELKSSFSIETKLNERKKIVSDTLTISKIKEIMIRLSDVSNESIEKYLQSVENLNKSSNIKITNILSDFPKIFTGRSEELKKIKESLDNCQFVYIYGRSGTGKTTLASKYTYLLQEKKPDYIIRWIDANKLKQCFMNLAEELNIDNKLETEELFEKIKVILNNKLNRNILFVIDNLIYDLNKNIKNDFDYLLNNFVSNLKFLITTKNQNISKKLKHKKCKEIELITFNQDESINFIDQKLNIVHKNKLQKEGWIKLLQEYIYLHLPIRLDKLISRINTKQRESFENIKKYLQSEEKNKFSTLKKENPYAYEILKYLSFLNRKTISYDFICFLMIKKESNNEEKQIEEDLINKSLNYLIENSEISINDDGLFYKIHGTTQNDIISTMSEDIEKLYLKKIISALNELINDELLNKNKIKIDRELNEYKEHSDNILMFHLEKIENKNENKIELLEKCAYIYEKVLIENETTFENYTKALEYYFKSLEIRKETLPTNHPDIASSYYNIGGIYFKKGDNDKAIEYYFKSLEIRKETLPPNHPSIATSYNNIGLIYQNKGDNEKALEYYSKSLEIRNKIYPLNHPDIAKSFNNIGLVYSNRGDYKKALEYYSKSSEIWEQTMSPNHPDIATSYNNIGVTYFNKGDNDKALYYYSKSLEILKETLPPNHPDIATPYNNIGLIYSKKYDNDKALEYYSKSLEILKETLPPNHPDIATPYNNIGLIYSKKGDNDKALEYLIKSLGILKETLPPNHPDIATPYNNIGSIYNKMGDNDKAIEYYFKSLEIRKETLPPNHPNIATSYINIGSIYLNKGDNDKALEYYSKSLEILKETLPPNHPDIATSYNNIGSIYNKMGDNDKAIEYYFKSLEIRKESLPPNHPNIATSYINIGSIYQNKGDNEKALVYYSKSLEIRNKIYPLNHPDIATSYNNIGSVYNKMSDNDKAIEYYFKSLEIRKETLPPNHPSIATSYNNIGLIYQNRGDNDKALEYYSKSLEILKETLPSNHPDIARSYSNIGSIYKNRGDNDKALEYFTKSIANNLK
jgi:tetratricopeptide (TPR) repeat protein